MKKIMKILGITLLSLVAAVVLFWGGLNVAKFFIYSEYYSMESTVCKNPGLGDGFVCQGVAVSETEGVILVSGYMDDETNSRIYITDFDGNAYYVSLTRNGKVYTGHAGGIALTGDTVYLANGSKLYLLSLAELLAAENGDTVDIGSGIAVNSAASFVFADESHVYVGEFHRDTDTYRKNHIYETAEGTHYAIISRYAHSDLSAPDKIYSIRGNVQGACFTPGGKIVLSTSYGLADSVYYVYNESDAFLSEHTLDGAPVYYLEKTVQEFTGPAMSEDMDYYNGMAITLTESASNKYIFGKFFFADDIIGLKID